MNTIVRKKISDNIVLEKSLLDQAGMANEIDIIVQDGVIFILPAVRESDWEALESLGNDAVGGTLENPSEHHDRYIYGESK